MAPSPARHPMERLLCVREKVHDASSATRINENAPPPMYDLDLHFPSPTHRPFYYAELVRLQNVIAFREGTAAARKAEMSRVPVDDKATTEYFIMETKEACDELEKHAATLDRFYDEATKKHLESWPEPEESRDAPCSGHCCSDEPPPDDDRVIYRYMGEARPNMCMLEAIHFETFMPDRVDLRYLHVHKLVVDKFSLKEGMLVWLASTALDSVPIRSRYRYRGLTDLVPYYVSWSVNDLIGIVSEETETWQLPYQICCTICDDMDSQNLQPTHFAGACSRFPFPIIGRTGLLPEANLKPADVTTARIAKRDAAWLYSVEPLRNLALYKRVVHNIDSSSTSYGYRVEEFSTMLVEDSLYADEHLQWFHGKQFSSADFALRMERSLSLGTALARAHCWHQDGMCFSDFGGYLSKWNPPEVVLYPSRHHPLMSHRYVILTFYSTISTKSYSISIEQWQEHNNHIIIRGRRSLAIEELARIREQDETENLPCTVRFVSSPTNALDTLLRFDLDDPESVQLPKVIGDLYDVVLPTGLEYFLSCRGEAPSRSRRILVSSLGRTLASTNALRYASAHPVTSFAVLGQAGGGKTSMAAAIALATPRGHKKLLVTTSRYDACALGDQLVKLIYTDDENQAGNNRTLTQEQSDNLAKRLRRQPPSVYQDCLLITPTEREKKMREFIFWPTDDIVIATIDSILQILHHHLDDNADPLLPFLSEVHTVIIDNAETVTEAYFYCFIKTLHSDRVVLIGDHVKAAELSAARNFMTPATRPILDGIVTYIRPHSMPVLQLKGRSNEREAQRAAFFVHAAIRDALADGLNAYTERHEAAKLAEVLNLLRHCRVPVKKVAVLAMDTQHRLLISRVIGEHDYLPEVHVFDEFEGKVRPVVIILGGWYARRYWSEEKFKDLYPTLYLDVLFFIGFNNWFKLRNYSEVEAKRCLVERKLCDFQKKEN